MNRIQNILVPHDFSEYSRHAAVFARDLALKYDARLTLLHVYRPPGMAFPDGFVAAGPKALSELMERINVALQKEKERIIEEGPVPVELLQVQGVPFSEILEHAKKAKVDLIVMGTHGRTGLRHALMGSVAEKVVRKAPCPVVTLRKDYQ